MRRFKSDLKVYQDTGNPRSPSALVPAGSPFQTLTQYPCGEPGISPLSEFPTPRRGQMSGTATPDGLRSRASSSSDSWAEPRHKEKPTLKSDPWLQRSDSGASFSSVSIGTRTAFLNNTTRSGRTWPNMSRETDF
ncbi:uncharacterized protein LOC101859247 [Aplysia californica]|uniref:Uncharacterized protein LOC101859247 n=1 Tax=Aplysia californica TaxID=6500 RepID=A0ABM0JRH9_APLCA|nr:uncharacterized protein LOC101859247 [Aplysia californica]